MPRQCVDGGRVFIVRPCAPVSILMLGLFMLAAPSWAQLVTLGPVTIGAGLQTSYDHIDTIGGGGT